MVLVDGRSVTVTFRVRAHPHGHRRHARQYETSPGSSAAMWHSANTDPRPADLRAATYNDRSSGGRFASATIVS